MNRITKFLACLFWGWAALMVAPVLVVAAVILAFIALIAPDKVHVKFWEE